MLRKDKKKLVREIVDAYRAKDERRLELLIRNAEDTLLEDQKSNSDFFWKDGSARDKILMKSKIVDSNDFRLWLDADYSYSTN